MARDQLSPEVAAAPMDPGEPVVPSRRSVLRGAAGAGVAGIAATAVAGLGGQPFAATAASEARSDAAPHADSEHGESGAAGTGAAGTAAAGPVVAHVRDAATGHIDLFRGTGQVQVRDPDLAARLVQAAGATSGQVS